MEITDGFFTCYNFDELLDCIFRGSYYNIYGNRTILFNIEKDNTYFFVKISMAEIGMGDSYGFKPFSLLWTHVEKYVYQILRELIIKNNISPCICELVASGTCKIDTLLANRPAGRRSADELAVRPPLKSIIYDEIMSANRLVKEGYMYNHITALVLEECDASLKMFLTSYVETPVSMCILKSMLFMIAYTLHCITFYYPKFRHYDMHLENILIKTEFDFEFNPNNIKYLQFDKYYVPYYGLIPKIIDFEHSVIPEEKLISPYMITKSIFKDKINLYGDFARLLHVMYLHLNNRENAAPKTLLFIDMINKQVMNKSYQEIMDLPLWDEYRPVRDPSQIFEKYDACGAHSTNIEEIRKNIARDMENRILEWEQIQETGQISTF